MFIIPRYFSSSVRTLTVYDSLTWRIPSRDRKEALPQPLWRCRLLVTLPSGRGSVTYGLSRNRAYMFTETGWFP